MLQNLLGHHKGKPPVLQCRRLSAQDTAYSILPQGKTSPKAENYRSKSSTV